MSDLVYGRRTTYWTTTATHHFTIHQQSRGFQVVISRRDASIIVDYPPKFGSLSAAKNYIDAWLYREGDTS